ncbi:leucyl/phenylalanyl-tRNA--protein transferase [uncultured Desulfovibrio sp.]|uniref:leucyl/phenylalanyl-tRNA--protein transferase n=1 Tax=uncultured Desulfovibrio sp. TaxID=167968 RepID=UPI002613D546|nr:leucyl/phenylalanyl-tRNA--protein transferase [uncultured Desulfovibrio sp.]
MYGAIALMAEQFPPVENTREDGLLCVGGDLRPERLLAAYSKGIFPWYSAGMPILWWSPDPRCVLPLEAFHLPARSARRLRNHPFRLTHNAAFARVIRACAAPRKGSDGTWLLAEMIVAYERLHALGYAHSVEAWDGEGNLAGGLYGVALGRAFFGESMFHVAPEASRAALAGLVELLRLRGATLLDCQQKTPHIMRMGGELLPRPLFLERLRAALRPPAPAGEGRAGPGGVEGPALPWEPWGCRYVRSSAGWSRS